MAYWILSDQCIGYDACGARLDVCLLDLITKNTKKNVCVIDAEQCIECGECAKICPVEAIEL